MPKGLKGFQKGHPRFTTKGDFKKGSIPWNKGKKLPEMCGKNHPNWKGGRDVSHGYIRLQVNGRVILEHRLIMMNKLGRNLKKTECIHHINGIKTDNRIENLKVVKRAEHLIKFHPHSFRGGSEIRICLICKKEFKTFLSNNNHYCGRKCFDKRGLLRKEKTNEKV